MRLYLLKWFPLSKIVVPQHSATTGLPTETSTVSLNADHLEMSKFKSETENSYVKVATRLQQLIANVTSKAKARTETSTIIDTQECN